eukprot:m.139277 g.139277  ORF g.139277 m.139277 type:complete len:125 (-) comp14793_c0_seq5:131-505(-)
MPPKKDDKTPKRKTRCPVVKEDGVTVCTFEWKEMPKLYALASLQPMSVAVRKTKAFLADHINELDPNEAIQYAVARGNTHAVNVLLEAGVNVQDFKYTPPPSEEEHEYLEKQRQAKFEQAKQAV